MYFDYDARPARQCHEHRRTLPLRSSTASGYLLVIVLIGIFGCGGGGSSSKLARATARERAIASARLMRGTFAVAGIGRTITRATNTFRPRLRLLLAALRPARDTPPDLDPGTGLFFVTALDADGSGRQDLFVDASHRIPAGMFAWMAPAWKGGVKNAYPATIRSDFQINGGQFAGERGTIDFAAADSTGANGSMHVDMTTHENEHVVAEFDIVNGMVRAKDRCTLPDGTTWTEEDTQQPDGGMVCTIEFPDGSSETITMTPDGDSTEVLTGPDGSTEATGAMNMNGMDTITFDDGSHDSVDVDTADAGDGGGSGESNSSDDGADKATPIGQSSSRAAGLTPRRRP